MLSYSLVHRGDLEELKRLKFLGGVNPEAPTSSGWTPLLLAAKEGRTDVVRVLVLGFGARALAARENDGLTPLLLAASNGHADTARLLIQLGADPCAAGLDSWQPVHVASYNGHSFTLETLVEFDANVDAPSEDGKTPAHCACLSGEVRSLKALAALGADFERIDHAGFSLLALAQREGNFAAAKFVAQVLDVKTLARSGNVDSILHWIRNGAPLHPVQWLSELPEISQREVVAWAQSALADAMSCYIALYGMVASEEPCHQTFRGKVAHSGNPHIALIISSFLVQARVETRRLLRDIVSWRRERL